MSGIGVHCTLNSEFFESVRLIESNDGCYERENYSQTTPQHPPYRDTGKWLGRYKQVRGAICWTLVFFGGETFLSSNNASYSIEST